MVLLVKLSFASCLAADQLETYNKCWANCKQASSYSSNALYKAVGLCYENICYLHERLPYLVGALLGLLLVML